MPGSDTAEQELPRHATRLDLYDEGAFPCWIGDDVLYSLYRIAAYTWCLSIYEPLGLVALEGCARAVPASLPTPGPARCRTRT